MCNLTKIRILIKIYDHVKNNLKPISCPDDCFSGNFTGFANRLFTR